MTQTPILTPSLAEVIVGAIERAISELHTGLPSRVVAFNPSKGLCSVKPLLMRVVFDEEGNEIEEELPVINNVPIHYPGGGGWFIIFPLKAGNLVYLSFAERSIDTWLEAEPGEVVDPVQTRKHDLSDAIAIPSLRPSSAPISDLANLGDNCRIGFEGGDPAIVLKPDGTMEFGEGATESMLLGDTLVSALQDLKVPTAFGPSGTPINALEFPEALSEKAKVK